MNGADEKGQPKESVYYESQKKHSQTCVFKLKTEERLRSTVNAQAMNKAHFQKANNSVENLGTPNGS